jgi:hypothetical protein
MPKVALIAAAVVFALVSGLHWIRYFLEAEIMIAGTAFPLFGSLISGVFAVALAAWMIAASRSL